MSSNNDSSCSLAFGSMEIVANSTGTRICGIASLENSTTLQPCCDQKPVQTFRCTQYCDTSFSSLNNFIDCLTRASGDEALKLSPFCQEGITSNNTQTLTSNAGVRSFGFYGFTRALFWLLVLGYAAMTAHGTIIPSLANGTAIGKRQDAGKPCTINITRNYTTTSGSSRKVSSEYGCQSYPCIWNFPVQTSPLDNNRTINGKSAAEPQYDSFFDTLQNQTGRTFPALSSLELMYSFVSQAGTFYMDWTPYAWCINGTATNCEGVSGDNKDVAILINACGPLFISDDRSEGLASDADRETIQGILNVLYN